MSRKYKPIRASKTDIIALRALSSDAANPRLAVRADMVIRCINGERVKDIAIDLGERPNTVILWKNRFADEGIAGLCNRPRGNSANQGNCPKHCGIPPDNASTSVDEGVNTSAPVSENTVMVPLALSFNRGIEMGENENNMDLEIVARVKGKDGTSIERKIQLDGAIPNVVDFDLSTIDGFRRDFDQMEKALIKGRDQIVCDIASGILDEASKKNKKQKA